MQRGKQMSEKKMAKSWYKKAADQGDADAKKAYDELTSQGY